MPIDTLQRKQLAEQAPTNLTEIKDTLIDTVKLLWAQFVEHLPLLALGMVLLIMTWALARVFTWSTRQVLEKRHVRHSLTELVVRLVSIGLWMMGLLVVGMVIIPDLTPTKALGGLGLFSLAIGFAFKDIFENFFAGMLMLWKFPFENGDFIECKEIEGEVIDVTARQTLIRRTSGEMIVVPNAFIFNNPVEVLTYQTRRRVVVMVGIAYGEDVENALGVLEQAMKSCKSVDEARPVQIFPQGFGDSSIDIEVAWWTGAKPVDIRRSRGEVVTAIKKSLDTAGIEIPFPYRTLTFKEPLAFRALNTEGSGDKD